MIVRSRLPMAVRVNVVPSRRRGMRGLGDSSCTPSNCPNGPYPGDNVGNYDYWLQQGQQSGAVAAPAVGTDPSLDTSDISASMGLPDSAYATYAQLQAAVGWENCDIADVSLQFACTTRNGQRQQQIGQIEQQYGDAPNNRVPLSVLSSVVPVVQSVATGPPTTSAPSTAPPTSGLQVIGAPAAKGGTLSFTTSRGGKTLYPGDTWTITISGATPNSPISVVGGQNGAMNNTPTGTTDAYGNFSLSGTIDSSQVGSWYEAWTVGGVGSGTITFTVAATPAAQQTGGTQSGGTQSGGTQSGGTQSGGTQSSGTQTPATTDNWFTDQMISGIPNWGLVAAAVAVAFVAFSSGGRR